MKKDLFENLTDVGGTSIKKAESDSAKKGSVRMKWGALAACAAVLAVVAAVALLWQGSAAGGGYSSGVLKVMAAYPEPVAAEMSPEEFVGNEAYWGWHRSYWGQASKTEALSEEMSGYYGSVMEKLLVSDEGNTVCSPLNTYIAFSMLAEVSGGSTRQQILDMLGASDAEALQRNVSELWESNYVDTPALKSLLANSLWLDDSRDYEDETLGRLAKQYYVSSFRGVPGSDEMNRALREWTDANTGGLLGEYTKEMSIDPEMVLEIISMIYYKAVWADEFWAEKTDKAVFHGTKGNTDVDMMHQSGSRRVYRTDTFTAVGLGLSDSGAMYFYLPAVGVDVETLVSDPDLFKAVRYDENDANWFWPQVNLSIPRFQVSSRTDLLETVRQLGVTDALDPGLADFTPLTKDGEGLFLGAAEHAAMIEIDEHGVTGAAYTQIEEVGDGISEEEIDFVADRPFLFLVTGKDGAVLFSGIVRDIE